MSTVTVKPGRVTVPALCVACGAPAWQPTNAADAKVARLDASGSARYGNKVFTEKMSFALCRDCAAARVRSTKGESYPGDWLPGSLGLVGMAFLVAFFVRVVVFEQGSSEWSGLTFAFFSVFFIGVVSAVSFDWLLRRRDKQADPPNEEDRRRVQDDRHRLALIGQAVRISPQVGPGGAGGEVVGVGLTFNDETFARAFTAANPGARSAVVALPVSEAGPRSGGSVQARSFVLKGEARMMIANVVIERPREVVWAFFTEPANWERWWGGAVEAAEWREGGEVQWALGGSSPITVFTPCESVRLEGAWMDTTFVFESEGTGRTAVRIEEGSPKGGASFKDGGAAHLEQLKSALAKLKDLVEGETPATSEGNASARPGTGSCPHCGGDMKLGPMALAMVSTIGDRGQASVQCGSCGASVTFGKPLPLDAGVAASPAESAQGGSDSVKADWYEDPTKRHQYRYWDGACWTNHVADGGNASVDPLEG